MTASTPTASTSARPFTWETTAAEVLAGVELTGRRAVVTGGASGPAPAPAWPRTRWTRRPRTGRLREVSQLTLSA
jgi:hypothetical protein